MKKPSIPSPSGSRVIPPLLTRAVGGVIQGAARRQPGCSFKKARMISSFSMGLMVQVEYTSRPPGLT